jgi:hypothetical protein
MAGRLRIGGNDDILPPPEAHLEIFEDLSQIVLELVGCGRSVEVWSRSLLSCTAARLRTDTGNTPPDTRG